MTPVGNHITVTPIKEPSLFVTPFFRQAVIEHPGELDLKAGMRIFYNKVIDTPEGYVCSEDNIILIHA